MGSASVPKPYRFILSYCIWALATEKGSSTPLPVTAPSWASALPDARALTAFPCSQIILAKLWEEIRAGAKGGRGSIPSGNFPPLPREECGMCAQASQVGAQLSSTRRDINQDALLGDTWNLAPNITHPGKRPPFPKQSPHISRP